MTPRYGIPLPGDGRDGTSVCRQCWRILLILPIT